MPPRTLGATQAQRSAGSTPSSAGTALGQQCPPSRLLHMCADVLDRVDFPPDLRHRPLGTIARKYSGCSPRRTSAKPATHVRGGTTDPPRSPDMVAPTNASAPRCPAAGRMSPNTALEGVGIGHESGDSAKAQINARIAPCMSRRNSQDRCLRLAGDGATCLPGVVRDGVMLRWVSPYNEPEVRLEDGTFLARHSYRSEPTALI